MKKIGLSIITILLLSNSLYAIEEPSFFEKAKETIKSKIPDSVKEKLGMESSKAAPNPAAPNPAVPNPAVPNPAVPNPAVPNPAVPNPAVPNPAVPNPAVPNPAVPNPAVPNPAVPNPAVPNPAVPNPAVPNPAVPDPAVPDPVVPDLVVNSSNQKFKKQDPNPAKKIDREIEAVKMLLQTKITIPEQEEYIDLEGEEEKKFKSKNNFAKSMLPEPFKSIKIGNNIIVFAKFKIGENTSIVNNEKEIDLPQRNEVNNIGRNINSKNPISGNSVQLTKEEDKTITSSVEKEIKLKKGMIFQEDWIVSELKIDEVVYENTKTKEKVQKYF